VLSDGVDRYSKTDASQLVGETRRRDVLVYPIAIGLTRAPVLVEVASVTGGRPFVAGGDRDLTAALGSIARELRTQYLLGYSSTHKDGRTGDWRSIRVIVNRPDVRVRARDGYIVK